MVGHAAAILAGEWITASGNWVNDRIHGQQFKARFLKTSTPTSLEGILPPPENVAEYVWGAVREGSLIEASAVTLKRLLIGYAIGLAIAIPLGLLISTSDLLQDTVGALALALQTLPSVCWIPLALLWFGQTEGAMLFVVIMGTVGSVVIATSAAPDRSRRSMRASPAPWAPKAWTSGPG